MMTGDFRITLEYLKEIGACEDGLEIFGRVFPDGAGYQETLDWCAANGEISHGRWLLNELGATDDTRVVEEAVADATSNIIFAGCLKFGKGVAVGRLIAGGGIVAGDGYGIFAGLCVRVTDWESRAVVTAAERPLNLISGHWREANAGVDGST